LKALLGHTILRRNEMVLVDMAAGVEFMGRASIQGIDALIVVAEPGSRSIETALHIAEMGRELGIRQIVAVLNKITSPKQVEIIKSKLGDIKVLGAIDYSEAVGDADLCRKNVFDADPAVLERLKEVKKGLVELI